LLTVVTLLGASTALRADLALYEPFDYPRGTPLTEAGAWKEYSSGGSNGEIFVQRPALQAPAGLVAAKGLSLEAPKPWGVNRSQSVGINLSGKLGAAVFYSFLFRVEKDSVLHEGNASPLVRLGAEAHGVVAGGLFVRADSDSTFTIGAHKRANNGLAEFPSGGGKLAYSATHFVVAVFEKNEAGIEQMRVWVNPPAESFGAATAPEPSFRVDKGNPLNAPITRFIFSPPGNGVQARFDELRVGSTWAEVTPRG